MEFEEKCKSGTIVAERMSLQEFAEKWIAGYAEPELEKTTVARYKGALNICIYPHIGYMKLNDIKSSTVIEFLNNLRKENND